MAAGAATPAAVGSGVPDRVQVTASTAQGLTLAVAGLEARWDQAYLGPDGQPRWALSIDGFTSGGAPGSPRVPTSGSWLVVPPGMRPQLRVLAETWQPADGRQLAFETMPVEVPGSGNQPATLRELLVEPDGVLPPGATILPDLAANRGGHAGPAVVIDEPVWWRGRRVAACRIVPVRYDSRGLAQQVLSDGRWEVVFVPEGAGKSAAPAANAKLRDGANDAHFAGAFLNGDLLTQLPTEGTYLGAATMQAAEEPLPRASAQATLLGPEARLAVSRTGPVRVTYSRLRQRGLIPDVPIQESQVRLYQRRYLGRADTGTGAPYVEVEVPIHLVGEGNAFDGDDFFVFYGLRLREDGSWLGDLGAGPETVPGCGDPFEMNNEANIYWLACAQPSEGGAWSRMATTTLAAASGQPLANFRHQTRMEEQAAFRENLPSTVTDRMYLNLHTDTEASLALSPFWRPDPAGGTVNLTVAVAGFNNISRPLRFELVTDTANVTQLEEFNLTVASQVTRNYALTPAAINGASTKVVVSRGTGTPSFPFLFAYLNWFEIAYDALYQAVGGELRFHGGDTAGARPMEVTGFTSADVGLLEITDPRAPVFVTMQAGNVVQDGATWKLSVMPTQSGTRRVFHALGNFGSTGAVEFNYVKSSLADDPTDPTLLAGGNPDLVVVTHAQFRTALDRWVQHRIARSGGTLKVHVVDVQDLYDWYSGGLRDPWAVKRFCNHALTRWESWALAIVGDANENALGKRVLSQADSWATDWVPTHYHTQRALSYEPELMASDKWYATLQSGQNYPVEDFPRTQATPFDMLAGRLPCNSVAELDVMIDKIITVESPQAGQDWRKRGLFIADDEWSNGYGAEALLSLEYSPGELDFLESERDSLATQWATGTGVPLEASLVTLKSLLDPQFPYDPQSPGVRGLNTVRIYTAASATPALLAALNQGGLFASYQGHANQYVLSSEYWMQDMPTIPNQRVDTALLSNTGRPWFFIGLGCHISDWAQNPVKSEQAPQERSIGEKLLLRPMSGASAVYASSGYEFIIANRIFGEYISRRWTKRPPAVRTVGPGASAPGRSRWVLGELLWAAESDLAASVAYSGYPYNEMIAQYELLGDPLMTLDGGEPIVAATLHGEPDQVVSGSVELAALDASNQRTLTISARDEAGIDRLEVFDDDGNDLTSAIVVETLPAGAQTHQRVDYALTVPVRPYDHTLTVRVYDTGAALPTDRHWELELAMPQTTMLTVDGQAHDPQAFVFETGVPVSFGATVTTAAWLTPEMELTLTSGTLTLTGVQFNLDKGHGLSLGFTATANEEGSASGHSVTLGIDGNETVIALQSAPDDGGVIGIGRVLNYPNPMGEDTRFLVETGVTGTGHISLWSVAGSPVARIGFSADGDDTVIEWDGRDAHGDELANGTYLYRVEIEGHTGTARSDMQRLVIMR
ncbi:MAG: hypothetical protein IPJ24_11320 [bacterium]|nr:hypothetical protein [bacterium]